MPTINNKCKKLCEQGICDNDCCGIVPFPVLTFNKYAYRAGVKKWQNLEVVEDKDHNKMIVAYTKDLKCIFLDKGICSIYEDRPEVCQKFGDESHELLTCPYLTKEGKRKDDKKSNKTN